MEELNRLLSNRQVHTQKLNKLRNQISQWQGVNTEQQTYIKHLVELEVNFSLSDAQEARCEKNTLQESQRELQSTLKTLKEEQILTLNKVK